MHRGGRGAEGTAALSPTLDSRSPCLCAIHQPCLTNPPNHATTTTRPLACPAGSSMRDPVSFPNSMSDPLDNKRVYYRDPNPTLRHK